MIIHGKTKNPSADGQKGFFWYKKTLFNFKLFDETIALAAIGIQDFKV